MVTARGCANILTLHRLDALRLLTFKHTLRGFPPQRAITQVSRFNNVWYVLLPLYLPFRAVRRLWIVLPRISAPGWFLRDSFRLSNTAVSLRCATPEPFFHWFLVCTYDVFLHWDKHQNEPATCILEFHHTCAACHAGRHCCCRLGSLLRNAP